jgi:hypothetical protein
MSRMRRWSFIVLLVIITATAVSLVVHHREVRLKRERAATYRQALRSYTDVLARGATRSQVEDNLRLRGVQYGRESGFDSTKAYADLVKIGTEPAPWYCNKNNIYLKFAFDAADPGLGGISQSGSDVLRAIEVMPWLQDCL